MSLSAPAVRSALCAAARLSDPGPRLAVARAARADGDAGPSFEVLADGVADAVAVCIAGNSRPLAALALHLHAVGGRSLERAPARCRKLLLTVYALGRLLRRKQAADVVECGRELIGLALAYRSGR